MVQKTTINRIGDNAVFALEPDFRVLYVRGKYKPQAHTYVCHRRGMSKKGTECWISQGATVYVGFPLHTK